MMKWNFETYCIDTNILVYATNKDSAYFKESKKILEIIAKGEIKGVITPQNVFEYISVVTSKKRVFNPVSTHVAVSAIEHFIESGIKIIYPLEESLNEGLKLADMVKVRGQKVFDVYLAATLIDNNIRFLITANDKDFDAFKKYIQVINPFI